ncbi:MAG TPA: SpoIIE family protein phosphatase, partial [Leptospiraceae bacterium]|nr:SpoIIE family protein phosphatase [Leptospiraceae bacterium]
MKMFDWRKIIRGIREKLSLFIILFIAVIVVITSAVNFIQQKETLIANIEAEIRPAEDYIHIEVENIERIAESLILIERFKENVKVKKQMLQQYMTRQYFAKEKEYKFLGMKIKAGGILGNIVGKDIYSKMGDTFFSEYLSEDDIKDLESNIKLNLKDKNGKVISDQEFIDIKKAAQKAAQAADSLKNAAQVSEYEGKPDSKNSEKQTALLNFNKFNSELRNKIFVYFQSEQKRKLDALKFPIEKIRIQSYSIVINENTIDAAVGFDTSGFLKKRNSGKKKSGNPSADDDSAPAIIRKDLTDFLEPALAEFLAVLKGPDSGEKTLKEKFLSLFRKQKTEEDALSEKTEFKFNDRIYRTHYSVNYKNLPVIRRAKLLTEKKTDDWKDYFEKEKTVQTKFRDLIPKIRTRLDELKKEKVPVKPSMDPLFIRLYQEYKSLIRERDRLFDEALKKMTYITDYETKNPDVFDIEMLLVKEAVKNLRNVSLYETVVLKHKSSQYDYEDYIEADRTAKNAEARKWDLLRKWIMNADSEKATPELKAAMAGGTLSKSRSEAEEMMWYLDSKPLFSEDGDHLAAKLVNDNKIGFTRTVTDMQEGYDSIRDSLFKLISFMVSIGLLGIVSAYYFSGRVVKKIKKIINSADELGKGNLDTKFEHGGSDEFGILTTALNRMTADLKHRHEMMMEYAAAEDIQKGLLPVEMPSNSSGVLEFGNFYKSMSGVGGDYYDYMNSMNGKTAFCIGDVSNHGIGPALVMVALRSHLHSLIRSGETDLLKILLLLNEQAYQDTPSHIFVTFFLGMFDPKDGTVTYCSCGHSKPALYKAESGKVELLGSGGMPLGAIDNDIFETALEVCTVNLKKGDIFFQYTDGLNEAMNSAGELYGTDRMENIIRNASKDNVE